MNQSSPQSVKKRRQQAIAAMRARLDARRNDKDELWKIISDYDRSEPDAQTASRATALVLGSIVEQGLESAILSHCITLDESEQKKLFHGGDDGPMNFALKIRLGYAIGIYGPDSRDDLDIVRHVRNFFAHEKGHITFADEVIIGLCDQLKWLDKYPWGGLAGEKPTSARRQYIETCRHFFSFFHSAFPPQQHGKPVRYSEDRFLSDMYA